MARMVKEVVTVLKNLIELDYDAIQAYEAAINRVSGITDKQKMGEFLADHRRHVTELSLIVRNYGDEPPHHGDIKQILTKGKVVLGGLVGEIAVFDAMKSNEDDTNRMYEKATNETGVPTDVLAVLERNLADERRHRAWFVERVRSLSGPGAQDRPSAPATTR